MWVRSDCGVARQRAESSQWAWIAMSSRGRGRQLELHPWRDEMTGALAAVSGFAPPQEQGTCSTQGSNAVVGHSRLGRQRAGFNLHSRRQSVSKAGCSELFMARRPRTRELAVSTNAVRTGHTQMVGLDKTTCWAFCVILASIRPACIALLDGTQNSRCV